MFDIRTHTDENQAASAKDRGSWSTGCVVPKITRTAIHQAGKTWCNSLCTRLEKNLFFLIRSFYCTGSITHFLSWNVVCGEKVRREHARRVVVKLKEHFVRGNWQHSLDLLDEVHQVKQYTPSLRIPSRQSVTYCVTGVGNVSENQECSQGPIRVTRRLLHHYVCACASVLGHTTTYKESSESHKKKEVYFPRRLDCFITLLVYFVWTTSSNRGRNNYEIVMRLLGQKL